MAGSDWSSYNKHFDTEQVGGGHPRAVSTLVKHLEIVRDRNLFTLEDAIKRVTALPATLYKLPKTGEIKEGYYGDITIFDYEGLKSNADFIHPFRKNNGIKYVIVSGKVTVEDGVTNGTKAGRIIKRAK